jgi:hypothetical protein|tara:strand:- start:164 stop:835 length:672 start_codon:yes stop_codon:yes gene_type:complete
MQNLLVLGCSVSDYTHVDRSWGEILAKKLGINYVHQAAGCGSNWRMWRKAFDLVDNNIVTNKDIVIVQYTELIRREFWSPYQKESRPLHGSNGKSNMTEAYDDGHIIRYKIDAHEFEDYHRTEKQLFKVYTRFLNEEFELEQFRMMHNMFQSYMADRQFKNVYFVRPSDFGALYHYSKLHKMYKNNLIHSPNAFENHLPNDQGHMDQQGHQLLADFVYSKLSI